MTWERLGERKQKQWYTVGGEGGGGKGKTEVEWLNITNQCLDRQKGNHTSVRNQSCLCNFSSSFSLRFRCCELSTVTVLDFINEEGEEREMVERERGDVCVCVGWGWGG